MGYFVLGALVSLGAGSVLIGLAKDRLGKATRKETSR
jgi:hypothetical protein